MPLHDIYPVANGLRTDHPIPELPFVADSHIPVQDGRAVEAVGRHHGTGMWGRHDDTRDGGWAAFTTDPIDMTLAWVVRWHPDHGRSVVLYRNQDAASVHTSLERDPVQLLRAGNYWWDGTTWYRPLQVFDRASESFVRRPVPGAATVTAADLLQEGAEASQGRVLEIDQIDPDAPPPTGRWLDDLACWAAGRQAGQRPLQKCVVTLSAPELTGDHLVGVPQMAQIAEIAPSTLRAYISRGEGEVPQPQATVGGRSVWARPVAQEWAERRRRSAESVRESVSVQMGQASVAAGAAEVWERFTRIFTSTLWENPERRKRWALRWRTQTSVADVAHELGWQVALNIDGIISTEAVAETVLRAFLFEFGDRGSCGAEKDFYGIGVGPAELLDWLIRHHPRTAMHTIGEIIGEAERRLQVPRQVAQDSIRRALHLDGKLDRDALEAFLEKVFTPVVADTSP